MRIGIFGGSFNPIHNGHTALAGYICDCGLTDEVWFMVSPQNPFKVNASLLDEDVRLEMARKAVEDDERLKACDFEFHLPRPSYTSVTFCALQEAFPEHTFVLIIGEDNWDVFPYWHEADFLMQNFPILVYPRSAENAEEHSFDPKDATDVLFLADAPLLPISSTQIREAVAAGDDISALVCPAVEEQIRNQHLYL